MDSPFCAAFQRPSCNRDKTGFLWPRAKPPQRSVEVHGGHRGREQKWSEVGPWAGGGPSQMCALGEAPLSYLLQRVMGQIAGRLLSGLSQEACKPGWKGGSSQSLAWSTWGMGCPVAPCTALGTHRQSRGQRSPDPCSQLLQGPSIPPVLTFLNSDPWLL